MITKEQTDVIRELIQGHDYIMQSKEERTIFNEQMTANNWQPIHDVFGAVYRWRHDITGRLINDTVAFEGWLPNYQLPRCEKPLREL